MWENLRETSLHLLTGTQEMHKNSVEGTRQIEQPSDLFGEGNGNPLWYSCLENPMGGGAW